MDSLLLTADVMTVSIIVGADAAYIRSRMTRTPVPRPIDVDANAINKGICPDCGANGTLLAGPSGGMSQNIACNSCLMEFNVGFGFGTGALMVDRTGKMDAGRARVFGIQGDEFATIIGAANHG